MSTVNPEVEQLRAYIEELADIGAVADIGVPLATLRAMFAEIDERPQLNERMIDAFKRLPNVVRQPEPAQLQCAACLQQAADAEALGKTPEPILPAVTVVQGMAICNERHRIVSQATAAGSLLIPQNGHLPGGFGQRAA